MADELPGLAPQHPLVYAFSFAPAQQRETLAGIWQLTHEMELLGGLAEPQVAAVKVPWWHEELHRWRRGEARHPATRQLQHLASEPAVADAVTTMFAAGVRQQTNPRCAEEAEFWERSENHALGLGIVAAYLEADGPAQAGYRTLGAGALAINRLINTAADARAGRILLPLELIANAGLDTGKLSAETPPEAFLAVRQHLATAAAERLSAGAAQIRAAPELAPHRYALVVAALYDACAQRLISTRANMDWPAPLRQLWIAWQTARRAH